MPPISHIVQDYYNGYSINGQQGTDSSKSREDGCEGTIERQADPSPYSHYTAADWAAMGHGVAEWIDAGYTAQDLKAAGYTARDLAESGLFGATELLANGYSASELAELDQDMARECGQQIQQQADRHEMLQTSAHFQPKALTHPSIHFVTEEWQEPEGNAHADDEIDVEELLALCV